MKKITKEWAKYKGLKTYFTGKECVNGHLAERRVDSMACCECQRERSRNWNQANKERVRENVRAWSEANADHVRKYSREVYRANPEAVCKRNTEYNKKNRKRISERAKQRRHELKEERLKDAG